MSEHERNHETIAWKNGADGDWRDDPRVTAYALGELEALDQESVAAIAAQVARDPDLRAYVEDLRAAGETLCVELGATESSSAKGGRLASALSAEALMAAAFKNEPHTKTVSAVSEKPHAAAGSGRRAREANKTAPSPFLRAFALGAAAAMLVISVAVGLMVANYGAQSPASPVAADVPMQSAPAKAEDRKAFEAAENGLDASIRSAAQLQLDGALELQTGQFKPGEGEVVERIPEDQRDRMIEEYRDPELERLHNPMPSVAAVISPPPPPDKPWADRVNDLIRSTNIPDEAAGSNDGRMAWALQKKDEQIRKAQGALQQSTQQMAVLIEENAKIVSQNRTMAQERIDTQLAWAPEKYRPERDLDPYYLDSVEVDPRFDPAKSAAMTRDSKYEFLFSGPQYPPARNDSAAEQAARNLLAEFEGRPGVRITESLVPADRVDPTWLPKSLDTGLKYTERYSLFPTGGGPGVTPPLPPDSTLTADAKPEAEVAETKKAADAPQPENPSILEKGFPVWEYTSPEAAIKNEIARIEGQIAQKKATVTQAIEKVETAEVRQLREDIKQLREQLAREQKTNAPIGTVDAMVENKYGPNAGVTTKEGKLSIGGLAQVWFYTIQNENAAAGLSRVTGQWVDGTTGDTSGSGVDIDGFAVRRGQLRFDMETQARVNDAILQPMEFAGRYEVMENLFDQGRVALGQEAFKTQVITGGINYFIKGHNAKLKFNYSVVAEDDTRIGEESIRNLKVAYGLVSKEEAWRLTRRGGRYQEIIANELLDYQINPWWTRSGARPSSDDYAQYHGIVPHHDFNQHWADQFRRYQPTGVLEEIPVTGRLFTARGFYVAPGYRLTDNIWADRSRTIDPTFVAVTDKGIYEGNSFYTAGGPVRGLWIRGEWSGLKAPGTAKIPGVGHLFKKTPAQAAPAPSLEAPGGMVVWHFNAADPARGQTNDMWRLTRVGGRFSDMMSSIDDYHIGGAVKDGGLALVGVDGEFDHGRMGYVAPHPDEGRQTESYAVVNENPFEQARTISTFSIDVDTASYSNVRRFLNDGALPPPGAVRYEELINYFRYAYEPPPSDAKEPFATHVEVATCPWNAAHRLVRIALKGREIDPNSRPSSNLVFLVDVSGSMGDPNKLDLVRQGLNLLVDNLGARDRVAIVTYSDKIKVELESTPCDQKRRILERINSLNAEGSTNGGEGIQKAYAIAAKNHIAGGTNRVILCTDGDFNVGTTSNDQLVKLIEKQAKSGVFLSVLGFGMGNYKDDKLEAIADKGNGHYAYIDSFQEAKKIFGSDLAGTLVTIAKDVKVQVEFNPATAHSYRLIGYENRLMRKEDFADDTKDAGEIGAGHTVTALYEVIPAGAEEAVQPTRVPLDVLLLNAKPEDVAKLAFIWKQTGGPKADLRDADRPKAYFLPTADGEYEFEVSAIADESVIKTTVKRTVKLAELAAPNAPAERASRYLEEAKVKEDAKTSGELLTVWLRYKQPEEDKSTELSVPVRDVGKKLEQSSQDFRFASSVAAFGMLLRGSVYAKGLNWDFVLELAGESKSADAEAQSQRDEFINLAKKAKALSGK